MRSTQTLVANRGGIKLDQTRLLLNMLRSENENVKIGSGLSLNTDVFSVLGLSLSPQKVYQSLKALKTYLQYSPLKDFTFQAYVLNVSI